MMQKTIYKLFVLLFCFIVCFVQKNNNVNAADYGVIGFDIPYTFMTKDGFDLDFEPFFDDQSSDTNSFDMKTYFKNLYLYSPNNNWGSCGYVSFIQYLSYYDTFFNDEIIPEFYERSQGNANSVSSAVSISPGVLRQNYPKDNRYEFIQNNKSIDFQMYLMDIYNSSMNINAEQYKYSIGMWSYYVILNELFVEKSVRFSYKSVSSFGIDAKPTDQKVIVGFDSYVKEKLDLGEPVILHIANYNEEENKYDSYHSIVAYYYDSNGIHANFGWGG